MRSTLKWIVGVCCLIGIYWVARKADSILDALALSLCRRWLGVDSFWIKRIENLKTRLAILESGETGLQESVEALYRGETVFHESVEASGHIECDTLHYSVDALYETVDKSEQEGGVSQRMVPIIAGNDSR